MLTAIGATACGASAPEACELPEQGSLTVTGTAQLNPDAKGRPLPTSVRIYQVAGLTRSETATFEQLWRSPEDALGETLLVSDQVTVYPRQRLRREFERDPAATHLIAVAIVRRPQRRTWYAALELPQPASEVRCAALNDGDGADPPPMPHVKVRLDGYSVRAKLRFGSGSCPNCATNVSRASELKKTSAPSSSTPNTDSVPDAPSAQKKPIGLERRRVPHGTESV